jgi:hypothetical protein
MMMNWKGFGRKWSWPNVKILSRHSPGETEENHNQDSWSLGRDLNSGPPEYEAGVLTIRPQLSVNSGTRSMHRNPAMHTSMAGKRYGKRPLCYT